VESTAALSSKVAAIEDEMRIIKGEVKQVLTEIRSAILVQDSPFEDGAAAARAQRPVQIVPAMKEEAARVEIVMPRLEAEPAAHAVASHDAHPAPPEPPVAASSGPARPEEPHAVPAPRSFAPVSAPRHVPRWSLLTVASLAAWAEEALARLGPKRLGILLDLCEVSGYLSPEARQALARVDELEIEGPEKPATPMEVTVLLRQLDALLEGEPQELRAL